MREGCRARRRFLSASFALLFSACAAFADQDPLAAALELFHRGDYLQAESALSTLPDSPRARAFLALSRAATSRCEAALSSLSAEFGSSTQDVPTRRLVGLGLVQCHLAQNRFNEAVPVLGQLRVLSPNDPDVLYQAARLHNRAWNETVVELFRASPASFRVNQLSAEVFEVQGKYGEAVAEYRKAIEKSPRTLNLHFRLGRALLMDSQGSESLAAARREFEAELALNPRDALAEHQVGQILQVERRPEEAAARFERALSLQPDLAEALIALGRLRVEQSRSVDAVPLLERAVRLMPRSEPARYGLMLAYRNAGRLADAQREKAELDRLQKPPDGEFTEFLKRLGEKPTKP